MSFTNKRIKDLAEISGRPIKTEWLWINVLKNIGLISTIIGTTLTFVNKLELVFKDVEWYMFKWWNPLGVSFF